MSESSAPVGAFETPARTKEHNEARQGFESIITFGDRGAVTQLIWVPYPVLAIVGPS